MPSPAQKPLLQRFKGLFGPNNSLPVSDSQTTDVGALAQAVPQVIQQSTNTLNPAHPTTSAKEAYEPSVTLERPSVDLVGGLQQVEQERAPEISPEVESFISEVGEHPDQLPQEIVITNQAAPVATTKYLATPVVILPITPEVEKVGAKKSAQFSVRWLVEWSHKIIKIFPGKVIYKEAEAK